MHESGRQMGARRRHGHVQIFGKYVVEYKISYNTKIIIPYKFIFLLRFNITRVFGKSGKIIGDGNDCCLWVLRRERELSYKEMLNHLIGKHFFYTRRAACFHEDSMIINYFVYIFKIGI